MTDAPSAPCVTCEKRSRCFDHGVCPTLARHAQAVYGTCKECGSKNTETQVENDLVWISCNDCQEHTQAIIEDVEY